MALTVRKHVVVLMQLHAIENQAAYVIKVTQEKIVMLLSTLVLVIFLFLFFFNQ